MWAPLWLALAPLAFSGGRDQPIEHTVSQTTHRVLRLAGQTSAGRSINIAAPTMGGRESQPPVLTYLVPAGTQVKKGQTLAQLDGKSIGDQLESAAAQVKQAKSEMSRRKAEQVAQWETLQQSLRQARADAEKAKMDARQFSALSDLEGELLRLNIEETESRYARLLDTAKLQKASFDAEMRLLDLAREQQQRRENQYARYLKRFTLTAPMDGLAVMQSVKQGDAVSPGQAILKVVDVQSMQLEARVNQAECGLVHVGQKVNVRLDGSPEVSLPGHVSRIGALAINRSGPGYYIRNIVVDIAIDGSDPKMKPDLPASGDIVLE